MDNAVVESPAASAAWNASITWATAPVSCACSGAAAQPRVAVPSVSNAKYLVLITFSWITH